ncbi:hypothetical protein [Escherichia coli]
MDHFSSVVDTVQALAMLRRVMTALEKQANAELNTNHYSRMQ